MVTVLVCAKILSLLSGVVHCYALDMCSECKSLCVGLTAIGGLVRTNERVSLVSFHDLLLILSAKSQVCCIRSVWLSFTW